MRSTPPTSRPGRPTAPRPPRHRRAAALLAAGLLGLGLGACTSAAEPAGAVPSVPAASGSSAAPSPGPLTVDVTIAGGDVRPNGQKLDVALGQQVVLDVTSDEDDVIHAHTGGEGYELTVRAGHPASGSFTLTSAGSFEVESHHLEKVIVVLNAR